MKVSPVMLVVAGVMLTTSVYAQNTAGDQEKGSTGWSGGAKDQVSQQAGATQSPQEKAAQDARDAEAAKAMPLMASGVDLTGPTMQFAPRKTPE
jgi:hypothetical protein